VLAIAAAMTFVLWWIVRSPWGRAFTALRENPLRAESLGVDVRLYTLLAFALGSAYGGMAGSLYARWSSSSIPARSRSGPSLLFMLMVVIGGSAPSSARSSAPASPCCCPNGCAPGRPGTC
jgi:branched-chain amino acid transport system permease protein